MKTKKPLACSFDQWWAALKRKPVNVTFFTESDIPEREYARPIFKACWEEAQKQAVEDTIAAVLT